MQTIRSLLESLKRSDDTQALVNLAFPGLSDAQHQWLKARQRSVYTGKVRDVVDCASHELLIIHSDRLTAFDRMIAMVPFKGIILNSISSYWLESAKKILPTHFIGSPHERVLRVKRTQPIKVEVVVRGYLAGALQRAYADGAREFCGVRLAEGLQAYGRLPQAVITPTTKAAAFEHDENTTPAALIAQGICSEAEWKKISDMALALFAYGQEIFARHGWILVDTKYEFGRDEHGEVIVIDEVHTPDSSRLWEAASFQAQVASGNAPRMFDKETVRRWLLQQGFSGYGEVPRVPNAVLIDMALSYLTVAEALSGHELSTQSMGRELDLSVL